MTPSSPDGEGCTVYGLCCHLKELIQWTPCSAMILPYCFSSFGVLANWWALDLVLWEHTERLEGRRGWLSFHGKHELYVPSGRTLMWFFIYCWRKASLRCLLVLLMGSEFQKCTSSSEDWLVQWKMALTEGTLTWAAQQLVPAHVLHGLVQSPSNNCPYKDRDAKVLISSYWVGQW